MVHEIVTAAESRFGAVETLTKHWTGDTLLLIRRSDPAHPSFPYMTVRGRNREGKVSFDFGVYDLTEAMGQESFRQRAELR